MNFNIQTHANRRLNLLFALLMMYFLLSCENKKSTSINPLTNYNIQQSDISFMKDFLVETSFIRAIVFLNNGEMDFKILDHVDIFSADTLNLKKQAENEQYEIIHKNLTTEQIGIIATEELTRKNCFFAIAILENNRLYTLKIKKCNFE
jgi:hypothetical protein